MTERTIKGWITISGRHIPIYEGIAVKRALSAIRKERNKSASSKIEDAVKSTSVPSHNLPIIIKQTENEVIDIAKQRLEEYKKDIIIFNKFENVAKDNIKNAGDCKQVAERHRKEGYKVYTGFVITKKKYSDGLAYIGIAHDFNVKNNNVYDFVNFNSANKSDILYGAKPIKYIGVEK